MVYKLKVSLCFVGVITTALHFIATAKRIT